MGSAVATVKAAFAATAVRDAITANFTSAGLPVLAGPLATQRRQLRYAAGYPAAAVELGAVTAQAEAAGGLRSVSGTATYWLALGSGADERLLRQAADAIDALRAAVESTLGESFQRLTFAGAHTEGELYSEAGVVVRLFPVQFAFQWLYVAGTA